MTNLRRLGVMRAGITVIMVGGGQGFTLDKWRDCWDA